MSELSEMYECGYRAKEKETREIVNNYEESLEKMREGIRKIISERDALSAKLAAVRELVEPFLGDLPNVYEGGKFVPAPIRARL